MRNDFVVLFGLAIFFTLLSATVVIWAKLRTHERRHNSKQRVLFDRRGQQAKEAEDEHALAGSAR